MTKRYEEDFNIPDNLKHRITKVVSNRKPGQEIVINPITFVTIFHGDLEKWLSERHMNKSNKKSKT